MRLRRHVRRYSKKNPLTQGNKQALAIGAGALLAGGLLYAIVSTKPAAAATNPPVPPPPAPPPPAPVPPAPVPPPVPPSGGPITDSLSAGQSYTYTGTTTLDQTTLGAALADAGATGGAMNILSGGIVTGTFTWNGTDGAAPPTIAGFTWIGLIPSSLVGVGQYYLPEHAQLAPLIRGQRYAYTAYGNAQAALQGAQATGVTMYYYPNCNGQFTWRGNNLAALPQIFGGYWKTVTPISSKGPGGFVQ